ncbi:Arc family DNA-binding protein [Cellulomonas humilata]|uniref:Arc family DNA-binding protein n=1 Tax=Cellulomonas humilata TaxID=144055 RepID=A0A7Y6A3X4_9CELL|nr:Arc family DNA-binding protein [Cellulomonas humilata]NUU18019.1 Arc family DNA-binding protein [Cellulomonas humilata]
MAMTLRLPDDLQEALKETAEREGRSMQAVAIEAVRVYTTERTRRRDETIARLVRDHRETLSRLA